MPKQNLLDRLAGAMKTLGKREGKSLTPRQRVAAAQRWNSLADIGEEESERLGVIADEVWNQGEAQSRYKAADKALIDMGILEPNFFRADNPFLSDNIDKYAEQSDFLDWCRYNHVRPSGQALKHFRTEKIYDELESGNLGAEDAVFQAFNAAGGFSPETGYDALDDLHSRMNAGNIGVLDAMDEAYLRGLRVSRKRRGW